MDHAEAVGSEDPPAPNSTADVPYLRGNSMARTTTAAGREDGTADGRGPLPGPARAGASADVESAGVGEGPWDAWVASAPLNAAGHRTPRRPATAATGATATPAKSAVAATTATTAAPVRSAPASAIAATSVAASLMSTTVPAMAAQRPVAGALRTPAQTTSRVSVDTSRGAMDMQRQREAEAETKAEAESKDPLKDGPGSAEVSESDRLSSPRPPSNDGLQGPHTLSSDGGSFDQDPYISGDDDASSFSEDARCSEHDVAPPQDQHDFRSERAPLENAYRPFIRPTDTCLSDARERLHVALEQTRLLRASFAEQAYERYRCVLKPIPESLNDIIGRIHSDPDRAVVEAREQMEAIKVEKEMEKKQAQHAGVGLEEVAYFGEGLHLVVLPEDDVDESELDLEQCPHRGPMDLQTGERTEEISAAAAASTEQVFDRIRRIRAIRMGADIIPGAGLPDAHTRASDHVSQEPQDLHESSSPGYVTAPLTSSPVLSVESDVSDNNKSSSTGFLEHLLTLSPVAEGVRPDGRFTGVQSGLVAHGVGVNEMKADARVDPRRQRMFPWNYLAPTPAYKCLPPLLGPHQIRRLPSSHMCKEGVEVGSGTRASINYVVDEIRARVRKGKARIENNAPTAGRAGENMAGSDKTRTLGEERSAQEIAVLLRMRSTLLEHQRKEEHTPTTPYSDSPDAIERKPPDTELLPSTASTGDFDPFLAFSVMSAVGFLCGNKDGEEERTSSDPGSEKSGAEILGLDRLVDLEAVSNFFHANSAVLVGRKRRLPSTDGAKSYAKKVKTAGNHIETTDPKNVVFSQISGGRGEEVHATNSRIGDSKKQKVNGVTQAKHKTKDALRPSPSLTAYAGFDRQSQSILTASRQMLQQHLAARSNPYHTAALARRLTAPLGSQLRSLPPADLSDFYPQDGLRGNPDWPGLRDAAMQHPHLRTLLGLLPGQGNLAPPEQSGARTMFHDQRGAAVARAHNAVTAAAAAARYQAALSSINSQHPFGFVASPLSQPRSNKMQSVSLPIATPANQREGSSSKHIQRQRSSSVSENPSRETNDGGGGGMESGKSDQNTYMKRPASAPPSPPSSEKKSMSSNGVVRAKTPKKRISCDEAVHPKRILAVPAPPKGLHQEVVNLIASAKFHVARPLSQQKTDHSDAPLIEFLLSLGAAVPIATELVAEPLLEKLSSSAYKSRLSELVGNGNSASVLRNVITATISIWLWAEHQDCFNQNIVQRNDEAGSSNKWLINLAIEKSLSALAIFSGLRSPEKNDSSSIDTLTAHVAAITSKSLSDHVFIDSRADATFPLLEDLLKLLDSLRTDAIQAKAQERVLLAALTSRCGNMSEAFSNAYVSAIIRAGVALGHENVCEIGQNEECQASTMLPYDFFHDNVGVWEEPCRPVTGYHHAAGGDELKKQAHARSMIQKSLKRLQNQHGLKGGISDGGPYFPEASADASIPSTPTTVPPLVRTLSGSIKRRGSYDESGVIGPSDYVFNPDHSVAPLKWNSDEIANLPYGQHVPGDPLWMSENKKEKMSQSKSTNPEDEDAMSTQQHCSTHELDWEDVANMFFHGGSTRNIDINYDFESDNHLGKKKIFAPFVKAINISSLKANEAENENSSDEDISDETIFHRHQDVLDEMKLKLDSALESRRQHPQSRGRK